MNTLKLLAQTGKIFLVIFLLLVASVGVMGAFSDALKLDAVFKHGVFKAFSDVAKAYYEETTPFNPAVHGDYVWLDDIKDLESANSSGLVVYHPKVTMVEDLTVSGSRAWYNSSEFPSGGCIPDSYNQSYTVKLYESDDTQIFLSDASDPYFEYETCRLAFQDTHSFSTPIKISVYTYNGSVVTTDKYQLPQSCAMGQVAEYNTTTFAWDCANDDEGAGGGITLSDVVAGVGNYSADNDSIVHEGDDQRVTIAGENVTSGTVADARIASTIARDSELPSLDGYYSAISNFTTSNTDEYVCTYESTGPYIACDGGTTGSGSFVKGTTPTIGTPLLTLSTTSSTSSGRIRYDATNDWVYVGDGASADIFMPVVSYTDEYFCSYEATGTTLVCDVQLTNFGSTIDDTELTAEDFGAFTCSGGEDGCSLDVNYLPLAGGIMAGDINMSDNEVQQAANITFNSDSTNHYIYDDADCVKIQAGTTVLSVCE